jgi:hypothetical protein
MKIAILLKTLAKSESSALITRIEFEEQNHHWMQKAV